MNPKVMEQLLPVPLERARFAYARNWWQSEWECATPHTHRCWVCGFLHSDPYASDDERRAHDRQHRQVRRVYEPVASVEAYGIGPLYEVRRRSSQRVRTHLELCAVMFRRECGLGVAPYSASDASKWSSRQFLLVSPEGRPVGGIGARKHTGGVWEIGWLWIAPAERGRGHLEAAWPELKRRMSSLPPELPLSAVAEP